MRLHQLEATAFGPFTGTVTVDFDRLSDAGLFLLSGATGAGKTSVLDAVCFALYGDVPGDRASAKRLRADLAEPDVPTRVQLEATLSGRRFRIVRSPSWQRRKKRGTGTTTEQASVTVTERVDGAWVPRATRLDEAGHLIGELVGMTQSQFTQVAMLPQGRFQAFLRARSEERHKLLHQLFRTGRFEQVERWLRERRVALKRDLESAHRTLADLVSRTSEAVAAPLPDGWDPHDLTTPALDGEVAAWAAALEDEAARRAEQTAAEVTSAAQTEEAARTGLDAGRQLAARQQAVAEARRRAAELDREAVEVDVLREALEVAARAATVRPAARLADRAERAATAARTRVQDPEADREHLRDLERTAAQAAAAAAAVVRREAEVVGLTASIEVDEQRLARLPALLEACALMRAVATAEQHADLVVAIAGAREAHLSAQATALDLGQALLDLRQARIEGMAAELAGALAVGASCPVCGSADHPHPAVPHPDAPDASAERSAARAVDEAKAEEYLRAEELRDLRTREAAVAERLDGRPLTELRRALEALDASGAELDEDALATERARLETALAHRRERRDQAAAEVAAALAGHDAPDLATLVHQLQQTERRAQEAGRALDALTAATEAHAEAAEALAEALADAGFDDADQARAAALSDEAVGRATARIRDHERRLAAVAAVLDAPDVAEVRTSDAPDLVTLAADHARALDALTAARAAAERWSTRSRRLADLTAHLTTALERWRPTYDDWRLTHELSTFCEGRSTDNRLQMRLSAYVLAFRLSQVVAAANERLARMSDHRYSLEHTGRAGAGETRGGLSLLVRDDWSGETRDPATLSGGETFVVSLALALGLADVITQEAGGAELDTLFVDEGFGSLDADTLDDVLDTLDELRDGGRVVGVVSHVAEMRDRIPTQLVVAKARTGSTVTIRS
ncbi:SMC family ATPase [Nocardioides anomalus]|uniref:Nuclease SbcCD subunit C n=1 Tax=Nocardioides anomalus TaxID=2712223 RepID=A0A6G6WDG8_9ACTN|nr:SMC family ATPase [Nocardioides anomalus]QIG43274.1 SMC family ATPase [Nocardioides anomalus]